MQGNRSIVPDLRDFKVGYHAGEERERITLRDVDVARLNVRSTRNKRIRLGRLKLV